MEPIEQIQASNHWGLFPWFPEYGIGMIHPDDTDRFAALSPNGKVFESLGQRDGYLVLAYGDATFRVKPDLFRVVMQPSKRIGELVTIESKGKRVLATIVEIHWHHQRNETFYLVQIDGKRLSKRYWSNEWQ